MATAGTVPTVTRHKQGQAKNLIQDVHDRSGASALWKPAPDDPTQDAAGIGKPGLAGIYPADAVGLEPDDRGRHADLPADAERRSLNFSQHVDDKVEMVGTAQAAPLPPTVQEIATAPTAPGEQAERAGMPRLTVKTLKKVSKAAPDGTYEARRPRVQRWRAEQRAPSLRGYVREAHIRKMPNFAGGIGALNAADRPSASALRVCAGSRMPSSQRRAVE